MDSYVAGLWRYPVKSMAGESLSEAVITADGIPGDRLVHVRGPEGVRTARRHYKLLGLQATLEFSPEAGAARQVTLRQGEQEFVLERNR